MQNSSKHQTNPMSTHSVHAGHLADQERDSAKLDGGIVGHHLPIIEQRRVTAVEMIVRAGAADACADHSDATVSGQGRSRPAGCFTATTPTATARHQLARFQPQPLPVRVGRVGQY
uniref:(northern house mosquito) hypothetical protein n=1 Tax=Culex pipiens TaxID=7175 RepID=A0A8D8JVE6_CULPI